MSFKTSVYDLQGLAFGIFMTALGVVFLKAAGLVTGQLAGLSLLLSYLLPVNFGVLFLGMSLPFMWLAWRRRGPVFTLRTVAVVAGISLLVPVLQELIRFEAVPQPAAALIAGCCCGCGLIALFRHNASAGGLGILALVLEEKTGLKAGWLQMGFDALIFLGAAFALPASSVIWSFAGAVVVNALIGWNFRVTQVARPA